MQLQNSLHVYLLQVPKQKDMYEVLMFCITAYSSYMSFAYNRNFQQNSCSAQLGEHSHITPHAVLAVHCNNTCTCKYDLISEISEL